MHARRYSLVIVLLMATMGGAEPPPASVSASPRALMEEGRRRYGAGDFTGALACFDEAARRAGGRLDPARARLNAAAALYRLGRLDDAEAALKDALGTPSLETQANAWYNRGRTAIEQAERRVGVGDLGGARDRMAQAVESFRNALRLAPEDIETKINFEWAQKRLKELEAQARQNQQREQNQPPRQTEEQKPDAQKPEAESEPPPQEPPATPSESSTTEGLPNMPDEPQPSGAEQSAGAPDTAPPRAGAPKEREMTKEDAIRLLDAMRAEEEALRRQLRRRLGVPEPVEKDW